MTRPKCLDLFCGAGGASEGYFRAGFEVVGVDIKPQPNYPFEFHQADAMSFDISGFDLIAASPPCQAYTRAQRIRDNNHPDLIGKVRDMMIESGALWVIENVPGSPLINPIELCGAMFGLQVYRHRLFECSFYINAPGHPAHYSPLTKMGRPVKEGEFMHVVGNFSGVMQARRAMGIAWMTRDELREAIPPAYSKYVGVKAMQYLDRVDYMRDAWKEFAINNPNEYDYDSFKAGYEAAQQARE